MMLSRSLFPVAFAALILTQTPWTQAQGTTIGGTASEGEVRGFMAMFTGDLFDNFRHMERFVPVSEMSASTEPRDLGPNRDSLNYRGDFRGRATTLEEFIELSNSSALIVIKNGEVVYERYAHGNSADSLHTSFSVAKSFTSALLGIALHEGRIKSLDDPIRNYLPELTSE